MSTTAAEKTTQKQKLSRLSREYYTVTTMEKNAGARKLELVQEATEVTAESAGVVVDGFIRLQLKGDSWGYIVRTITPTLLSVPKTSSGTMSLVWCAECHLVNPSAEVPEVIRIFSNGSCGGEAFENSKFRRQYRWVPLR